jgi:hypothetical protein
MTIEFVYDDLIAQIMIELLVYQTFSTLTEEEVLMELPYGIS